VGAAGQPTGQIVCAWPMPVQAHVEVMHKSLHAERMAGG